MHFPSEEKFGLISQMRRSIVSVPSNIVEGCARSSQKEYLRFLEIAFASLRELRYQFSIAHRLSFINQTEYPFMDFKMNELEKIVWGLIKAWQKA